MSVPPFTVRALEERDLERAADVNFTAFYEVAIAHGLAPAVATPAESRGYLRVLFGIDPRGGFVAEEDGEIVGVAWVHPRGPVATIGPLAVAPRVQGRGIGRRLLEQCIEAAGPGLPQVRLAQDSFNTVSLGLYLRAGFRVVAPLLDLMRPRGPALMVPSPRAGIALHRATRADAARVVARDARAFGAPRPQSVEPYLRQGHALVAERGRTLAGYALGVGVGPVAYLGAAAADDPDSLLALVLALAADLTRDGAAVHVLVPAIDRALIDGLAAAGFRVFRACQYMVRGGGTAPPPNYVLMNGDML